MVAFFLLRYHMIFIQWLVFFALFNNYLLSQVTESISYENSFESSVEDLEYNFEEQVLVKFPQLVNDNNNIYFLLGVLPPNLSYDTNTRVLSGDAIDIGEWTLYYLAYKNNKSLVKSFKITITPNEHTTEEAHWRRALQFAHSSSNYVKQRVSYLGQKIKPFKQSRNKNQWELKVDLKLARVGVWENVRSESFFRFEPTYLAGRSIYESEGIDFEVYNFLGGVVKESTKGSAHISDNGYNKVYSVNLDYDTIFTAYKNKSFNFWLSNSLGKSGKINYSEFIDGQWKTFDSKISYKSFSGEAKSKLSKNFYASFFFIKDAELTSSGFFNVSSKASSYQFMLKWNDIYRWRLSNRIFIYWKPAITGLVRLDKENEATASGYDIDIASNLRLKRFSLNTNFLKVYVKGYTNDYYSTSLSWQAQSKKYGFRYKTTKGYTKKLVNELFTVTFLNQAVSKLSFYPNRNIEQLELFTNETLLAGKNVRFYYRVTAVKSILSSQATYSYGFQARKGKEWSALFEQRLSGSKESKLKITWKIQ